MKLLLAALNRAPPETPQAQRVSALDGVVKRLKYSIDASFVNEVEPTLRWSIRQSTTWVRPRGFAAPLPRSLPRRTKRRPPGRPAIECPVDATSLLTSPSPQAVRRRRDRGDHPCLRRRVVHALPGLEPRRPRPPPEKEIRGSSSALPSIRASATISIVGCCPRASTRPSNATPEHPKTSHIAVRQRNSSDGVAFIFTKWSELLRAKTSF